MTTPTSMRSSKSSPDPLGGPSTSSSQQQLHQCTLCQSTTSSSFFPSRNQLFQHLRTHHNFGNDDDDDNNSCLLGDSSPLDQLTPSQRTAASIAARSVYHNVAHDAYYRAQVTTAGAWTLSEWEEAQRYFRSPLPVAFRSLLSTSCTGTKDIRWLFDLRLKNLVPPGSLQPCPAFALLDDPYYSSMASTAVFPPRQWSSQAQQALIDAQEVGVLNRQEICSMIPPLLLLSSSSSAQQTGELSILDLCAAPGSKSLQLLDMMHHYYHCKTTTTTTGDNINNNNNNNNNEDHTTNTGQEKSSFTTANAGSTTAAAAATSSGTAKMMLVCNDANRQRLLTVARRSRRQPSHYRSSVILNSSDGRYFPTLRQYGGYRLKFTHVLVDVPCSGDGMLRKVSANEWKDWNVQEHLQLHNLQVRLLTRGLEAVQKGGRVVYSTCSLDPIEDEAVVVSAIAKMGGPSVYRIVSIIPPSSSFHNNDNNATATAATATAVDNFPYSPGATKWVVPHPQFGKVVTTQKRKRQPTTPTKTQKQQEEDGASTTTTTTSSNDRKKDDTTTNDNNDNESTTTATTTTMTDDDDNINYDTFLSMDQVPLHLRRKDIRPTMFPPHARTEAAFQQLYQEQHRDNDDDYHQEAAAAAINNQKKKLEQSRHYGELLSQEDITRFEEMLPNCARIFPQHLNSGGFFCAIIERVAPAYYAICYPLHRKEQEHLQQQQLLATTLTTKQESVITTTNDDDDSNKQQKGLVGGGGTETKDANSPALLPPRQQEYKYHGRILYPVESTRQVRDLIVNDKAQGDEIYFEGVATKKLAIQWLKMHRAYLSGGISETLVAPPTLSTTDDDDDPNTNRVTKRTHVNDPERSPLYTPLFRKPHPSLVEDFCNFFGLYPDHEQAELAGVEAFPVNNLIVAGGGEDASSVTSCLDPDEAHTMVRRDDSFYSAKYNTNDSTNSDNNTEAPKIPRKRRFLQLTLISDEIRTLFKGGAKFSPIELGLALCWVPVPGRYRENYFRDTKAAPNNTNKKKNRSPPPVTTNDDGGGGDDEISPTGEVVRFEDATARAVQSGRYGLLDEAAEYLGRCATRRIVGLSQTEALQLLRASHLVVPTPATTTSSSSRSDPPTVTTSSSSNNVDDKATRYGAESMVHINLWNNRWGKQKLVDLIEWSPGATIAVVMCCPKQTAQKKSHAGECSTLFLPCVLKVPQEGCRQIELLAEQRLSDAWKRLLEYLWGEN